MLCLAYDNRRNRDRRPVDRDDYTGGVFRPPPHGCRLDGMIREIHFAIPVLLLIASSGACSPDGKPPADETFLDRPPLENGILVAQAVLDKDAEGKPLPQPAQLGILTFDQGGWHYRTIEDADSNVFHKAMAYAGHSDSGGILTFGGTRAIVKLWSPGRQPEVLWEADFGGRFSRMRDAEVADIFGDGSSAIALATHDQGVVAVVRPNEEGLFDAQELDRQTGTFVHEIEIGDLDGDSLLEIYATPSAPNKLDGTPQPGKVVRYVPAAGEGRTVVADLDDRHAKEILVEDFDDDGFDELYVSVEAVSGGNVEIRRFDRDTDPAAGVVIAELQDTLCRFLTAGDIDGDGRKEMVAATYKSGLWLLRRGEPRWSSELIDPDSSGFEHAAVFADLDEDGVDELYVASDKHDEIRRYLWRDGKPLREVIHRHTDGLSRFTWNLMPAPVRMIP